MHLFKYKCIKSKTQHQYQCTNKRLLILLKSSAISLTAKSMWNGAICSLSISRCLMRNSWPSITDYNHIITASSSLTTITITTSSSDYNHFITTSSSLTAITITTSSSDYNHIIITSSSLTAITITTSSSDYNHIITTSSSDYNHIITTLSSLTSSD